MTYHALVCWLAVLLFGLACIAFLNAIWPRWEGPVEDSISEQEEKP